MQSAVQLHDVQYAGDHWSVIKNCHPVQPEYTLLAQSSYQLALAQLLHHFRSEVVRASRPKLVRSPHYLHSVRFQVLTVLCRSAAVSSAKPGQPQPLLLQLLQLLDQQTTVDQPAPAELVFAVLATPFVDDVVSSEIYQLLNFRVGHEVLLSDLADMPQLPDGDIIAFSFLVMREGVLAWKEHHEAQPVTGCSKSAIRQRRLFKATSAAAVSCIRADMAAGVMTHAQTAAAKALLLGSWPTESKVAAARQALGCVQQLLSVSVQPVP